MKDRFPLRVKCIAVTLAVAGLMVTSACGPFSVYSAPTPPTPPTLPPTNTAIPSIYVGNLTMLNQSVVLQFHRDANGVADPFATLNMPSNFSFAVLTTDSSGRIYVGGSVGAAGKYTWEVLVYAPAATGNDAPVRTIVGTGNSFETIDRMTVDSAGQVYVLTSLPNERVVVMSASADGAATPLRIISGGSTQISQLASGIAVDSSGTIFVASSGTPLTPSILAFASTANGNAAPVRVISGANTGMLSVSGMDTDADGNVYVMSFAAQPIGMTTIEEFAAGASENVAPIRTISGSNTGLGFSAIVHVDSAGLIYTTEEAASIPAVAVFAAGASGNAAPVARFTSTSWLEESYYGLGLR